MGIENGVNLGSYTIDREIGRGGMGVVYLGHDTRLDRPVAIKALPDHLAEDADRLSRFEREARTLAQLNHPNVAGIHGVEQQDGQKFLILEYVDGDTLDDRIDDIGKLAIDDALEIAIEIARGVEAAHEAGIVHRDLKPANIKITPDGKVKVLDFGLAKIHDAASSSAETLAHSPTIVNAEHGSPTTPGVILGTAPYMSPEQARGRSVDKRTDIWSFGVLLYEMLTGIRPFAGETVSDSIGAILHKDVDLNQLPPDAPPMLRSVIRKCLQRDRNKRVRDIGDVRLDLEECADPDRPSIDAAPANRSSTLTWIGWLAAAIAVAALGWSVLTRDGGSPAVVRSSIMAPAGYTIDKFDIAPDGSRILATCGPAFSESPNEPIYYSLYVRDLDSSEMELVPETTNTIVAWFSPDSQSIAFLTRDIGNESIVYLHRVPADRSSPPVIMTELPPDLIRGGTDYWMCWTPDGNLAILSLVNREVVELDPGNGREVRRTKLKIDPADNDLDGLHGPFGDNRIAIDINRYTNSGFGSDCGLIDLTTGALINTLSDASVMRRTPRGGVLFSRDNALYYSAFDENAQRLTGEFRPVQGDLATINSWDNGQYAFAQTGDLLFKPGGMRGQQRELVLRDRGGNTTVWSDDRRGFEEGVSISPDGSRLAVIVPSPGGLYEIWVSDIARPRLRRLLAEPGTDFNPPVFTPDGEYIIATRLNPRDDEMGTIQMVRFDGTEPARRIYGAWGRDEWVTPESVSPDGSQLLMLRRSIAGFQLQLVSLDGNETVHELLTASTLYSPRLYAIEGSLLLAYVGTETGRPEAYVRAVNDDGLGPAVPVTTRGAWHSEWIEDPEKGPCILYWDIAWHEWTVPISVDGRLAVGEPQLTGRRGEQQHEAVSFALDGTILSIRHGADEGPATHLELVQNWLSEVER